MSDIVSAPNTFTKSWNTTSPVEGLVLQFPGRVFINQNPSLKVAARVVVTSSSQAVVNLFGFNATQAVGDSINIGCSQRYAINSANQTYLDVSVTTGVDAYAAGSLLVLVTVQKPISWVKSTADTVIVSGALVNGASKLVSLTALGAGNITTTAKYPVTLSNLTLATTGTGKVHYSASTTGSVFVTTNGTLTAQDIRTYLFGNGNVSYYPSQGTTINNTINLFKSGHVYTGSIVAQNSTVAVSGAGGVVVQVNDTLTTSIDGAGVVSYYNKTLNPAHLPKPKGWWVFSSPSAVATSQNTFSVFKDTPEPTKVAVNVTINLNRSWTSRCFTQRFETTSLSSGFAPTEDIGSMAMVALAFLALVVLAVFKVKGRTGYTALPK